MSDEWELALILLARWLPASTFQNWIAPLYAVGVQDNRIRLAGPPNVVPWTRRRYYDLIDQAIREVSDYEGAYRGP